jgi:hypothetical protein
MIASVRAAFAAILLCACSTSPGTTSDLASPPSQDLATGAPDLSMRPTSGIACGPNQCASMGQYCCTGDNGVTGDCTPIPTQNCAKSTFYCDGPEDCAPAEPVCCVSGGVSQCTTSGACAMKTNGTAMCHTTADCGGATCCPAPTGPYALCLPHC